MTASAIRHFKASATGRARLLVGAASAAARCGAADLLPGRLSVPVSDADIESHLSRVLGHDVLVALYLGPRRAVEKPVLQVLTTRGVTAAFAKLGTRPITRDLIQNEVATLRRLGAAERWVLDVPPVLHAGAWREHELIVQGAVVGTEAMPPPASLVARAIRETASIGDVSTSAWSETAFRAELRDRVGRLASPRRATLEAALTVLDDLAATRPTELGAAHGDWAPWNMARRRGRLTVWDWEHWRPAVPVGFDAVHHDLARLVTLQSTAPTTAFGQLLDGVDTAVTDEIVEGDRAALVTAYVADLAVRYMEDGEDAVAGTPLSRLDTWLAPVLERCIADLRRERAAAALP